MFGSITSGECIKCCICSMILFMSYLACSLISSICALWWLSIIFGQAHRFNELFSYKLPNGVRASFIMNH